MKKQILYFSIIIFPFVGMVILNEFVRINSADKGFVRHGVTAINSDKPKQEKCSWVCHNNTDYCKEYHVKLVNEHFETIDPLYFGIINTLQSTGNYGLANIIVLVVVIPLMMYILLIKSISLQFKIQELSND